MLLRRAPLRTLKRSRKRRRKTESTLSEAVQLLPDTYVDAHKSARGELMHIPEKHDVEIVCLRQLFGSETNCGMLYAALRYCCALRQR